MDVAVIVASHGAPEWEELAQRVAVPSAHRAGAREVIVAHDPHLRLHEVRNAAAATASSEWLCFLDADDELELGYLAAMADVDGDLRAPAVRYVTAGEPEPEPLLFTDRNIATMNPCVIGTLIRREMFVDVGGFWNEPVWEDWSLFRRAWCIGAKLTFVPGAVYRVNVNPNGRNLSVAEQRDRQRIHREIVMSHGRWKLDRRRQARR